jgi:mannose-6-phosphate isomerase-like protein (cupin superfamily)
VTSRQPVKKIEKPWGHELLWAQTEQYAGKVLHIKRGHRLSLQYHERKEETIFVYAGRMLLVFADESGRLTEIPLAAGEAHHIPVGRRHRMIAIEDCDVFEVSTNELDDVVRVEDAYGRAEPDGGRRPDGS